MVMKHAVLCIGLAILTSHAFAQNEAQTCGVPAGNLDAAGRSAAVTSIGSAVIRRPATSMMNIARMFRRFADKISPRRTPSVWRVTVQSGRTRRPCHCERSEAISIRGDMEIASSLRFSQ
jgi:hypothetical protein